MYFNIIENSFYYYLTIDINNNKCITGDYKKLKHSVSYSALARARLGITIPSSYT